MIHQANANSSRADILEKIKNEFQKFRGTGHGKYTPELRALTCSAVGVGIGQQIVADASGVSLSAVYKWVTIGRKSKPKAKRLNLVADSAKAVDFKTETSPTTIRVRLVSGVEIDLSKSELNLELLTMLSAVGGQR